MNKIKIILLVFIISSFSISCSNKSTIYETPITKTGFHFDTVITITIYDYLPEETINEMFPEVGVAPYVVLGGTDSRHFTGVSDSVVRFAPVIMDPQQLDSVHGIDENIYVESLKRATEFFVQLISKR